MSVHLELILRLRDLQQFFRISKKRNSSKQTKRGKSPVSMLLL